MALRATQIASKPAVFAFMLAVSCGGSVTSHGGLNTDGGSGSTGGTGGAGGTGGVGGIGGTSDTGGAGRFGAGGSAGTGGSGGMPDACSLAQDAGPCNGAISAWWHDPSSGVCVPFIYGGCAGNANRFPSRDACEDACPGGSADMDACNLPEDCQLLPAAGCCSACGDDNDRTLIAVNNQYASEYQNARCGSIACGPCPAPPPGSGTSQYFVPTCRKGQCTVVDIRQNAVSACMQDSDCHLRFGAYCCDACGGSGLVSVSDENALSALVCGSSDGRHSCPACAPMLPNGYTSACTDGHCAVVIPSCTMDHPCPL